jgi:hypothetical protein
VNLFSWKIPSATLGALIRLISKSFVWRWPSSGLLGMRASSRNAVVS